MKILIAVLSFALALSCNSQKQTTKFNLDFEKSTVDNELFDNWFKSGTYNQQKDSVIIHSGKYSSVIIADTIGASFGSIAYRIPAKYAGDSITLQGFMKTENVENGFAGLLLSLDANGTSLVMDNMQSRNIKGTKDWTKYSITLPYPEDAEDIVVAGLLVGKGKAWFDDFTLTINGHDIQTLKESDKPVSKATLDKEFDAGSKFNLKQASEIQLNNLFKLCKIWGFLKYYHLVIAKGDINWDYELFKILPKTSSNQFDKELIAWLKKYPMNANSQSKIIADSSDIKILPDTKWILNNDFIAKDLCQELIKIQNSVRYKSNYYISLTRYICNPIFDNENPYPNMKWNDSGYQLLALFRYWNIIEYFFPNKHLIEKNWDNVLKEYIPKMILCNSELDYKLCILSLIGQIHDTHANIWQQDKVLNNFYGEKIAPLEIGFIENKPVVIRKLGYWYKKSKIKVGDIITKVNGVEVEKLIADKIKYCPASNYSTQLRDLSKRLLRMNNDSIVLTFQYGLGSYTETIGTINYEQFNSTKSGIPSNRIIGNDIGCIYPAMLKPQEIDGIMKSFINKKGIIIDMRCYPSVFIVFSLGKYLMPYPTDFVKFTTGSLLQPGLFTYTKALQVGENNKDYFKGKLIIIVDENTQSQAEYTTMALRVAPNAKVIGSTTAGADGNVSSMRLPGNIRTMISGIGVYYPNGTETQRIGIVPDIEIMPTIEGIRGGKDELLEKAIELINEK